MKHIKTPVRVAPYSAYERGIALLLDADDEPFGQIYARSEHPALAEIVTALNEHDDLIAQRDALAEALEHNAHNWHVVQDDPIRKRYCWCYHEDGTINPQCQDQPQCVMARAALAQARGEGDR